MDDTGAMNTMTTVAQYHDFFASLRRPSLHLKNVGRFDGSRCTHLAIRSATFRGISGPGGSGGAPVAAFCDAMSSAIDIQVNGSCR